MSVLVGILALSATVGRAQGTISTVTFDDVLPYEYAMIGNGYGGLQWNNFYIQNGLSDPGFHRGAVSGDNVAFTGFGTPGFISSSSVFTLQSVSLTAVYVSSQRIRVQGFAGGTQTYDNTYTVGNQSPTLINFNYVGVDQVRFSILSAPGGIFAMDNLVVAVPEPGSYALMLMGVALGTVTAGGMRTRSRKAAAMVRSISPAE